MELVLYFFISFLKVRFEIRNLCSFDDLALVMCVISDIVNSGLKRFRGPPHLVSRGKPAKLNNLRRKTVLQASLSILHGRA